MSIAEATMESSMEGSQNLEVELLYGPAILLLGSVQLNSVQLLSHV